MHPLVPEPTKKTRRSRPLSRARTAFCWHYVQSGYRSATASAQVAHPTATHGSAEQLGYRYLRDVRVKELLAVLGRRELRRGMVEAGHYLAKLVADETADRALRTKAALALLEHAPARAWQNLLTRAKHGAPAEQPAAEAAPTKE